MGYEYFYQNIAECLLLSMLISIDFPLQILILDIFLFNVFINAAPSTRLGLYIQNGRLLRDLSPFAVSIAQLNGREAGTHTQQ